MTLDQPTTTADPVPPEKPAEPRVRWPPLVGLAVGVVPFAVHAWVALHGYFWQDDFIITYRAAAGGPLDVGYLFQGYNNEHLAPGMFLLAWLVTWVAPLSYPVAVLPLLVMQAVTSVLLWRLLVRCFGARWAIIPPFAIFTFSPLILLPTLWWAYGVQLIPLLLTMVGALGAHVRYVHDGDRRHAVFALLWTVAGMAFYEKAALFAGLLFGITVLLAPPRERAVFTWALRRYRPLWLAHAGLLAGYAVVYLSVTRTRVGGGAPGESVDITGFVRRLIADTFLPGVLGGPLGGSAGGTAWATPPTAVRLGAAALAVGIVIGGLLVGRRRAGLAWLLLAGYVAVDLILVAVTRLERVGTIVGADPRYIADAVPVAVLCAAFAYLRPREVAEEPAPDRTPLAARVAVAGLTVAFAVAATVSQLRLSSALPVNEARDYVATARAALAREPGIVLYDGDVPPQVLLNWFIEDARPSRLIGLLPEAPRFDVPAERLYLLDQKGNPHPVDKVTNLATAKPGPAKDCGYAVADRVTIIPLTAPVIGRLVVRLEYYTADAGKGVVTVAGRKIEVDFDSGLHVLHIPVEGSFVRVDISRSTPVAPVCIANLIVGQPVV